MQVKAFLQLHKCVTKLHGKVVFFSLQRCYMLNVSPMYVQPLAIHSVQNSRQSFTKLLCNCCGRPILHLLSLFEILSIVPPYPSHKHMLHLHELL